MIKFAEGRGEMGSLHSWTLTAVPHLYKQPFDVANASPIFWIVYCGFYYCYTRIIVTKQRRDRNSFPFDTVLALNALYMHSCV